MALTEKTKVCLEIKHSTLAPLSILSSLGQNVSKYGHSMLAFVEQIRRKAYKHTLFLYLMYYHPGMGLRLHAVLGVALCMLFILHHFLNFKWYAVLFKGQYYFRRIILTASDFLLLIAMLGIMVSSFMISGLSFPISFLPVAFYKAVYGMT